MYILSWQIEIGGAINIFFNVVGVTLFFVSVSGCRVGYIHANRRPTCNDFAGPTLMPEANKDVCAVNPTPHFDPGEEEDKKSLLIDREIL